MSKFTASFEDETLRGLQEQIANFLFSFNGIEPIYAVPGVNADDNGGKDQLPGGTSFGNDKSEDNG